MWGRGGEGERWSGIKGKLSGEKERESVETKGMREGRGGVREFRRRERGSGNEGEMSEGTEGERELGRGRVGVGTRERGSGKNVELGEGRE